MIKQFDGKGTISGKLYVAAPEGRTVSHNGIEIIFQSSCHSVQAVTQVVNKAWTLLDAGDISGAIEIGFDVDLAEIKVLRDSFNGQVCQLRHSLNYRIVRPWYTFSVRGEEPLLITNATVRSPVAARAKAHELYAASWGSMLLPVPPLPAPPRDACAVRPQLPETAPPEPTETSLQIDDFGGLCIFDHGKCTFSADGRLVGSIVFSGMDTASPIASVVVIIVRGPPASGLACCGSPPDQHAIDR